MHDEERRFVPNRASGCRERRTAPIRAAMTARRDDPVCAGSTFLVPTQVIEGTVMEATALAFGRLLFVPVLLIAVARANAAIYAVGSEAGCTHATIQEAVDAAEANGEEDFIRIPHSRVWNDANVVIDTDETLWLEGFWADCNNIDFNQQTVLDGAGGSASSVLRISTGANGIVRMSWLTLRSGDPSPIDGQGGGIHFSGRGRMELSNDVAVINNSATSGGGIYANGDADGAQLVIGARVIVSGNTAHRDGGGIFVNGMTLTMNEPDSFIAFNEALGELGSKGYGGGLVIRSTGDREAYGYVGSSGVGALGVIYGNEAKWGGGVAVSVGSDTYDVAELRLVSADPALPPAIRGNFASEGGGAIFAWPNANFSGFSTSNAIVTIAGAEISDNAAPRGAVAYGDNSSVTGGATVGSAVNIGSEQLGADLPCGPVWHARIFGNEAVNANGDATDGALFHITDDSSMEFHCALIEGNAAGRLVDSDDFLEVGDSLIESNVLQLEIIRTEHLDLHDSTVAGNAVGAANLIEADRSNTAIRRSILWQPGHVTLAGNGGAPDVFRVIASEIESLGDGSGIVLVAEPRFIDPARGDYRLRAASRAIDFAPPVDGDDFDALGLPRDQRLAAVPRPDASESRDIGAFERQSLLPLALNGDFAGDTNLWFVPVGHTGNYGTANAPGSPDGTGSAQITGTNGDGHLYGYAQCIHLPGPGVYALNASALTSADPQIGNPTALLWDLRADGGEGCIDGSIMTSGAHEFGTPVAGGDWVRPANPSYIDVPESIWNPNTSLTLVMAVYANASNSDYNGYFDRITLEWNADASDVIFQDGFEHP
jgi:predicted outer membrane repeat protein